MGSKMQNSKLSLLLYSTMASTLWANTNSADSLGTQSTDSLSKPSLWSQITKRSSLIPVLAYAPETKLQYGALWVYGLDANPSNPSRAELSLIYTQNQQLKSVLYIDQWTDQRHFQNSFDYRSWPTHYYKASETGRFRDYSGIYDNNSFEYEGSAEQNFFQNFWLGLGWNLKQSDMAWPDSIAFAERPKLGVAGGLISGPALLLSYDRRDHVLEPSRGIYASWKSNFYLAETMSDFNFSKHSAELRGFVPLASEWVWASSLASDFVLGDTPYMSLSTTDGARRLRGVDRGVVMGRKVLSAQTEMRFPLLPRRPYSFGARVWNYLNGVAFVDGAWAGALDGDIKQNWLPSYGLGMRWALDREQKTYLRFDGAIVDGAFSPVIYIREAF